MDGGRAPGATRRWARRATGQRPHDPGDAADTSHGRPPSHDPTSARIGSGRTTRGHGEHQPRTPPVPQLDVSSNRQRPHDPGGGAADTRPRTPHVPRLDVSSDRQRPHDPGGAADARPRTSPVPRVGVGSGGRPGRENPSSATPFMTTLPRTRRVGQAWAVGTNWSQLGSARLAGGEGVQLRSPYLTGTPLSAVHGMGWVHWLSFSVRSKRCRDRGAHWHVPWRW